MTLLDTKMMMGMRVYDSGKESESQVTFVLIHGLGLSLDFWNSVAPSLSRNCRTIAFDVPGFGGSRAPKGPYDLSSVARMSAQLLDLLDVKMSVMVGHSLGALVALRIACDRPDIVRQLALISGTLFTVEDVLIHPYRAVVHPKMAYATLLQFVQSLFPMSRLAAMLFAGSPLLRRLVLGAYVAYPERLHRDSLADAIGQVGAGNALNVLRAISAAQSVNLAGMMSDVKQTVALVWGDQDPMLAAADIRRASELLSVVDSLRLESCGHWPVLESPDAVTEFLLRLVRFD